MVKEWKKQEVAKLRELMSTYKTIGVAGIRGISARQMQQIRKELKDRMRIRVSKNSLITRALEGTKSEGLIPYVYDQTALIFTNLDPFKLYKIVEEGRTPAPIKAGAVAPCDIVVERGPTPFKPGPIVGELQNVGIPATIEGGKVVIKETKVVVKEGEKVPPKIAEILRRLEIYPIKVGLDLRAACDEDGVTYTPELLRIDEEKYFADFVSAVKDAFSLMFAVRHEYPTTYTAPSLIADAVKAAYALALEARYPTRETIEVLLQDAYRRALSLSVEACTYEKEAMPFILSRAYLYSQALAKVIGGESAVEYIYAALLLHSAGREINEENLSNVLKAAGIEVDAARVKTLVAALDGINIEEAIAKGAAAPVAVTAAPAAAAPAAEAATAAAEAAAAAAEAPKEEKKEEEKKEEEEKSGLEGLAALFG